MKCKQCKSNNILKDSLRGITLCNDCGNVLEESEVVCEVGFENSKVIGTYVDNDLGFSMKTSAKGNVIIDPSMIRLKKAHKAFSDLALKLSKYVYLILNIDIGIHAVEIAKRYFNIATTKKFIQGRKLKYIVGAILYTTCRLEKTKHLLIDFSDALRANLYTLGSIYLKFVKLLNLSVPLVDPSFFIQRYCGKLDLKNKTKAVTNTALE